MLDILRANKGSVLAWVFLGAIIVVFVVSFGPGSFSRGQGCGAGASSYAARVDGRTVSAAEFDRELGDLVRMEGGDRSALRERSAQLRELALARVVNRALVVQEAQRRGFAVSDAEIGRVVHADPRFQQNGKFDFETYERYANNMAGSPAKFEGQLREELLLQRMLDTVRQTVKVPDEEVRQAWLATGDRANVTFVRFPLADAEREAAPTDAEARAWADAHPDRVKKYYEENASRFDQRKRVRVRHLLAAVPAGAKQADDDAARARAEELAKRARAGEDFAKLAEHSDDQVHRTDGGELGFVTEGTQLEFEPAFVAAAMKLQKGEVSAPVRDRSGWHVLQAEEVVPAKKVSLEDARVEIAKDLLARDRARQIANDRAKAALAALQGGKRLEELFPRPADASGDAKGKAAKATLGGQPIAWDETGTFTAYGAAYLPKLGPVPDLARDALAAQAGQPLPKVYDTPQGPVVAVVKTRERPDPSQFAAQKDRIAEALRTQAYRTTIETWLKDLRAKAKVQVNDAFVQGGGTPVAQQD